MTIRALRIAKTITTALTLIAVLVLMTITTIIHSFKANATSLDAKHISLVQQQLAENHQRYGSVSQNIQVTKNGKLIYQAAYGLSDIAQNTPVHEDQLYPVYSLAKLFASMTLMPLVESGKVDLDSSIATYLPNLPKHWHAVTVRHCLNHTSGIPEYFSLEKLNAGYPKDVNQVYASLAEMPFQFTTGEQNRYNNTNYLIIGSIIESVTQTSYLKAVERTLLKPLALNNTLFASAKQKIPDVVSSYWGKQGQYEVDNGVDWPEFSFSHSGLYATKQDLQKFINGILDGKIVSQSFLKQMWQPMKLNSGKIGRYSSGWEYKKTGDFVRLGHEGGNRVRLDYHYHIHDSKNFYTSIYLTNGNGYSGGITSHLVDGLMATIAPNDFPELMLQEKLLNRAFDKSLRSASESIYQQLSATEMSKEEIARFVRFRGYTLFYSANAKHAIPLFEFYTQYWPEHTIGWNMLAQAWLQTGNKQNAKKYFAKALTIDDNQPQIKAKLAALEE